MVVNEVRKGTLAFAWASLVTVTGHLSATVDVLDLDDDGRFVLPAATRRIWIEVGCNSRDTLSRLLLAPENSDVLLVQFEPLLDKYAWLLSSSRGQGNIISDEPQRPGFASDMRVVIPFAVAPDEAGQEKKEEGAPLSRRKSFRVSELDGCSSFLTPRTPQAGEGAWGHLLTPITAGVDMEAVMELCRRHVRTLQVPTLSLEHFLGLIFGRPGGQPRFEGGGGGAAVAVEYLKVDAQGYDLEVDATAGPPPGRRRAAAGAPRGRRSRAAAVPSALLSLRPRLPLSPR